MTAPDAALERTDRSLRRLVPQIEDANLSENEDLGKEVRRAERQLRSSHTLFAAADSTGPTDEDGESS